MEMEENEASNRGQAVSKEERRHDRRAIVRPDPIVKNEHRYRIDERVPSDLNAIDHVPKKRGK